MPYFTTAELRALPNMNASKYTDVMLDGARDWIEALIERECGTSFVARAGIVETFDGDGTAALALATPYVQSVEAVSVGGVAYTSPQLAALSLVGSVLRQPLGGIWLCGVANITVTLTGGYSTAPPADLKGAALQAARYRVLTFYGEQGQSDRTMSISTAAGTTQFSTASADRRPTGLPEVDATIEAWADTVDVFGFA